jgi:hypothetical protein
MDPVPGWVGMISRSLPGIVVAGVSGIFVMASTITGFLWRQSIDLAEMAQTLKVVCEQIATQDSRDDRQDRDIQELRLELSRLRR